MPCVCEGTCNCSVVCQDKEKDASSETCCEKCSNKDCICAKAVLTTCDCKDNCNCISSTTHNGSESKAADSELKTTVADCQAVLKCGVSDCTDECPCPEVHSTTDDPKNSETVESGKCSCSAKPGSEGETKGEPKTLVDNSVPSIDSDVEQMEANEEPEKTQEEPPTKVTTKLIEEEMAILDKMGEGIAVDPSCGIADDTSSEAASCTSEDVCADPVGEAPLATAEEE